MGKLLTTAGAVLATTLALAAPPAMAATEFGDTCAATSLTAAEQPITLFEVAAPGNPLPPAAPSAGVITQWRVNLIAVPVSYPHTLKVLRPTGPNSVQIVAEAKQNIGPGLNTLATRIPVQAGDRLGLFGDLGQTLFCKTFAEVAVYGGFLGGGGGVGSSATATEQSDVIRVPSFAVLEPDVDGDGFGDDTQDKCPRSATLQTECPVAIVDSVPIVQRGSVLLLVSTTTTTSVTASGTVKLPGGRKKARVSAQVKLKPVTKTAEAAKIARIKLAFPAKLKNELAGLKKGRSLSLKLTASVTDVVGQTATDSSSVKLRGQ